MQAKLLSRVLFFTGTNNFTAGTAEIQSGGGSLTLNSGDSWTGTAISNTGGIFNIDGFTHNTGGKYTQSSGNLNLSNNAALTLVSGSSISGGNISLTDAGTNLTVSNGASLATAAVVNIGAGTALNVSGGTVELTGGSDTWTGTINVDNASSTLTLNSFASNGVFNQTAGATTIASGTITLLDDSNLGGGTLTNNGTLNLSNAGAETVATQFLDGTGAINKNAGGTSTFTADNSGFTSGTYTQSAGGTVIQNKFFNGTNNFTGGTAEIQSIGSLTLNSGDSWTGTNISNTGGDLTLRISHTSGGTYNQTLGDLHIASASTLTLASGSTISGGTVNFIVNGNTLEVATDGNFNANASLTINSNNTFKISGGTATLNSNDTWSGLGTVNISSGNLTIDGIIANGIYDQTGGNTTLTSGTTLTLSNDSNLGDGNLISNGILDLSNTDLETVATQISGNGTINKNAAGESTFTANNSGFSGTYNQTDGSVIIQNAFFAGTNNLISGSAEIQPTGSLVLNSASSWTNTIVRNTGGNFTLGISHTSGGTYNQTLGALHITNSSALTAGVGSTISNGTVDFTGTGNTLNIATGGNFDANAALTINTDNTFRVSGGNATLNINDIWNTAGKVDLTGGSLILDGVTTNGIYTQTTGTGTLHLASASILTLGTGSTISAGTVNLTGTGNTLDVSTGGVFASDAAISIATNNLFKVSGGTATLNGTGTGIDTWTGTVDLSGGTLTVNNLTHNALTSGAYTQSNGTLNLIEGSVLTVDSSNITGGEVDVSSTTATKSNLKLVYPSDTVYNTSVKLQGNALLTLGIQSQILQLV